MDLPTVRVKHPEFPGGILINQADFDPAVHVLATESPNEQGEGTESHRPAPDPAAPMEAAITRNAVRLARRDVLHALKFVELKEKLADLGVAIVKTGTTKDDLVTQILDLEAKAGQ